MQAGKSAMAFTRGDVVAAARSWVGTPFLHQGRIKGRAVDCVGLGLCVAEELGVLGASSASDSWTRTPDYTTYGPQPLQRKVFDSCVASLVRVESGIYQPGDILSLRVPTSPCHIAFVSKKGDVFYMIHAYSGRTNNKCIEHVLDSVWRGRIAGVFKFPGMIED